MISKAEALKLASSLIAAAVEKNKIDFAVYDYKKSKAGKIYSAITSQK